MKIWRRLVLVPSLVLTLASPSFGQDVESRLKTLEDTTKAQQQKIEEQQRLIDELKSSPRRSERSRRSRDSRTSDAR